MWNGVDTTWRATIPGWEDSRQATVSCNPALQLRFSFLPKWLILLWIAGVLAPWRDRYQACSSTAPGPLHRRRTYIRTHINDIYLYPVNTRLSRLEVGHDCERLSPEARIIWDESLRPNAGIWGGRCKHGRVITRNMCDVTLLMGLPSDWDGEAVRRWQDGATAAMTPPSISFQKPQPVELPIKYPRACCSSDRNHERAPRGGRRKWFPLWQRAGRLQEASVRRVAGHMLVG